MLSAAAVTACVGPSRTDEDYRRKVANTAQAVASSVESALMTVEVAGAARAVSRYVSLRLSEDEEAVAAVERAFGTVQPPDPELDELRNQTLAVVGDASDLLEELRIASYRGDFHRLPEIATELSEPLERLKSLMDIAPT